MTSRSSDRSSESAKVRLRLWRERSPELLRDLEAFLPTNDENSAGSSAVPTCSLTPSDSQAV